MPRITDRATSIKGYEETTLGETASKREQAPAGPLVGSTKDQLAPFRFRPIGWGLKGGIFYEQNALCML